MVTPVTIKPSLMKNTQPIKTTVKVRQKNQGFTLILTISLMVLLTMVAIGVLSLSSVTLRTSAQGNAMSLARSNARLALMMALGELQRTMGPDKAISATSEIVSQNPAKPNLMGAWQSWDFQPDQAGLNYTTKKTELFNKWLVSDINPQNTFDKNYPTSGGITDAVELVGTGSLGGAATDLDKVKAGRVPILVNNVKTGTIAWHVADEAAKARINSYRDPKQNDSLAKKRSLLTGHRPNVAIMRAPDQTALDFMPNDVSVVGYSKGAEAASKLVDLNQVDLFAGSKQIGKFRNAVTPYSYGLLTDARNGGFKQDLSSLFEMATMPVDFNNKKLYASTHGITGVSDPNWTALQSYYSLYRDVTSPDTSPTFYRAPQESITTTTLTPPRRFYPAPVIAKVEVLFTYVTRDAHGPWVATLKGVDPKLLYMGHLVYTPIVTIHNPYNINVSFDKMQVLIRNVPVAFNFYVNNKPQNAALTSVNEMFVDDAQKGEKSFALDIANWTSPGSASTSGAIVMRPGQTLVCGPYLNPAASFDDVKGTPFFDWQNNLTGINQGGTTTFPIAAKPGFAGKAVGFDIDWVTPTHVNSGQSTDGNQGVMGLRATDQVYMEYAVKIPSRGIKDRFEVSATITSRGRAFSVGGLNFMYRDEATLSKYFNKTYRYPLTGNFPASEPYHSNTTPISAQGNAKSVALFSAYARTTNGGVFETNTRNTTGGALNVMRDGRVAGKPLLFHNPARAVVSMDLRTEVPGMHSHEMNFVPLPGHVDDVFEIDNEKRNNVLLGNTTTRGIKSGSYLELPTGPMQTIADFRRSNALTTSYLPNFVQPVANSVATPLMSTNKVVETGITTYALLDHSTLANHALYDKFYFSTIAPYGNKSAADVLDDFFNSTSPLLNQAYTAYLPDGQSASDAAAALLSGGKPTDTAVQLAAQYQMVRGAFNVNSTSVEAWKAMLSSMKGSNVPLLWARSGILDSKTTSANPVAGMSLMNSGDARAGNINSANIDNARTNEFNGFRELTDAQIGTLATEIVKQVRERGPFLSMSEFVNRQIGASSEKTRAGALQAAIDKSQINGAMYQAQIPITLANISDAQLYKYKTPEVVVGNPAEGAPGWVMQGDLMRIIEPLATVRSDTFVVRSYGEALDNTGRILARAYAEAVVQRVPEYVNPINKASVNVYTDATSDPVNKAFGRRIKLVSFRWLSQQEV